MCRERKVTRKALISQHGDAAESDALIGNWKLVSWQVIVENEAPQNVDDRVGTGTKHGVPG